MNALMFGPEGVPLTPSDIPDQEPKSLSHSATRILKASSTRIISEQSQKVWTNMSNATPSLFQKSTSPKVNGYSFVAATPSPMPHQDVDPSELMTWGMIEGTPLLMEMDLPAYEPGPSFTMPPTSDREILSNHLSMKATHALKQRARGGTSQFKVPLARQRTPLGRLARAIGSDSQLRASYSPKRSGGLTPTPVPKRSTTPVLRARSRSVSSTPKGDITDGLLDI